jgi:spore germination cell wall hydrolase CwlJ-like protein
MIAVACVIRTRVQHPRWWGANYHTVCMRPAQFSCWGSQDPNFAKLRAVTSADPAYADALLIAAEIASGRQPDITGGADTYADLADCHPSWADPTKITCVIGRHTFFRLELPAQETAA